MSDYLDWKESGKPGIRTSNRPDAKIAEPLSRGIPFPRGAPIAPCDSGHSPPAMVVLGRAGFDPVTLGRPTQARRPCLQVQPLERFPATVRLPFPPVRSGGYSGPPGPFLESFLGNV